jgi:hypothetical protein
LFTFNSREVLAEFWPEERMPLLYLRLETCSICAGIIVAPGWSHIEVYPRPGCSPL